MSQHPLTPRLLDPKAKKPRSGASIRDTIRYYPSMQLAMVLETKVCNEEVLSTISCVPVYAKERFVYPILAPQTTLLPESQQSNYTNTLNPNGFQSYTEELDDISQCIDVLRKTFATLVTPAPAPKRFYDEEYGMTYPSAPKSTLPPPPTLITEMEFGDNELHAHDPVPILNCAHRDWEECNVIRRYGLHGLPVYIFDLPPTEYNPTTNTTTLHGELAHTIFSTISTPNPRKRTRTWAGKPKKGLSKATSTCSTAWHIATYGYAPYTDWDIVHKLATEAYTDPYYWYPLEVSPSTAFLGPNSPICYHPTGPLPFPCLNIDYNYAINLTLVGLFLFMCGVAIVYQSVKALVSSFLRPPLPKKDVAHFGLSFNTHSRRVRFTGKEMLEALGNPGPFIPDRFEDSEPDMNEIENYEASCGIFPPPPILCPQPAFDKDLDTKIHEAIKAARIEPPKRTIKDFFINVAIYFWAGAIHTWHYFNLGKEWFFRLYYMRYAYRQVKRIERELERWKASLFNFVNGDCSYEDKTRIIEIKSILHLIYCVYTGDKKGALGWGSNFCVTRREHMGQIVSFPYEVCRQFFSSPKAEVTVNGVSLNVTPSTWTRILARFDDQPKNTDYSDLEQDVEPNSGFAESFATMFSQYCVDGLSQSDIREANAQYTYIKNRTQHLTKGIDTCQTIISIIGRTFFAVDPFDPEFMSFIDSMLNVIEFTRSIKLRLEELNTSRELMRETIDMTAKSDLIFNNPRVNTAPKFLQLNYRQAHNDLADICRMATVQLHGNRERDEPTSILLTGPPSGGKSALTKFLMQALCRFSGESYDNSMCFSKPTGSPYNDGYGGQRFYVMDDLWKELSLESRAVQTSEVISMINTAPYNLNMAKLENKGNSYFRSQYVIFSTNIANNGILNTQLQVGATDNDAIMRRFHICIHQPNKLTTPVHQATWRVDVCPYPDKIYSDRNPRMLTTREVCELVRDTRALQLEKSKAHHYTDSQIDEIFSTHAAPVPSASHIFFRLTHLNLYAWSVSEYCAHYICLFALIVVLSTGAYFAPYLYSMMFPMSVDSRKDKDGMDQPGMVRENGKWIRWEDSEEAKLEKQEEEEELMYVSGHSSNRAKYRGHNGQDQAIESLNKRVAKSVLFLSLRVLDADGDQLEYITCVGSHMQNQWVLTCMHWFVVATNALKKNAGATAKIYIKSTKGPFWMHFPDPTNYRVFGKNDAVIFRLDPKIPLFPSLIGDVISTKHIINFDQRIPLTMFRIDNNATPRFVDVTTDATPSKITYSTAISHFWVSSPIGYYYESVNGQSGSLLLMAKDNSFQIVGMHVGSRPDMSAKVMSYAIPLHKEVMEEFMSPKAPKVVKLDMAVNSGHPDFPLVIDHYVPEAEKHWPPTKSRIGRSDVNGWQGPPECIPAKLNKFTYRGQEINPLYMALSKIKQVPFDGFEFPEHILDVIHNMYSYHGPKNLISIDEAINGVVTKGIPSIRLKTSPGYPYTLTRKREGKNDSIIRIGDHMEPTPEFRARMESYLLNLKRGINEPIIWADNLKDETRPKDKVYLGKTRVISSCPLHFLIAVRMYFAEFIAHVQSTPAEKPISVGINVHSLDWQRLYDRMKSTAGSVISGDFSNFDGSVPAFMNQLFVKFVNRWYGDSQENQRIRELLLSNTTNAYHIIYDIIYQACGGVPSGDPLTAPKNSFISLFMFTYILIHIMGVPEDEFNLAIYGDDVFCTTLRKDITWKDFAPHLKDKFGMTFTHSSKSDLLIYDTLETVTYLGRRFEGRLAPLPIRTIIEMTYWYRGESRNKLMVLHSTVDCYFTELSHYPKHVFDCWCDKFLTHVLENDLVKHEYAAISAKRRSWEFYQERKYCPRPGQAPIKLYFDEDVWGNHGMEQFYTMTPDDFKVDYAHLTDFTVNSGKPDPDRLFTKISTPATEGDGSFYKPVVTHEEQMGNSHDINPTLESSVDSTFKQPIYSKSNLPQFDMDGVLNRTYQVGTAVWNTADAANTVLGTFLLPDEIITIQYVLEKISDFRYLDCGFQFILKLKAADVLFGTLLMDLCPHPNEINYSPNTINSCSGGNHVLAFCNMAGAFVFNIPFIQYRRFLDIDNYVAGDLGRVRIRVLNPLTNVDGLPFTLNCVCTCQMVDTMLSFPQTSMTTTVKRLASYTNKLSDRSMDRIDYTARPENLATAPEVFSFGFIPTTEEHLAEISDETLPSADTDYQNLDDFSVNSGKAEARLKSEHDSISDVFIRKALVPSAISLARHYASKPNPFSGITNYSAPIKQMLGLSKPMTLRSAAITRINPSSDYSYGQGIDMSQKMCIDPENSITTVPNVAGVSRDEMDLLTIMQTPAMTASYAMAQGTGAYVIGSMGPVTPSALALTYVDWVTQNFQYWSGSIKYKIYVCASPYHEVELVFWVANTTVGTKDWENCYHQVYEIKGTCEIEFTMPYADPNVISLVGTSSPLVFVAIMSFSQKQTTAPTPIYLNIYKAAGPDYRVYVPVEATFTVNCNPRSDFEKDFPMFIIGATYYETEGYVIGEKLTSLRQVLHQPHSAGTPPVSYAAWTGVSGTGPKTGLAMWSLLYYFWRGSLGFKYVLGDSRYMDSVFLKTNNRTLPFTYWSSPVNPQIEFIIPYFSHKLYSLTSQNSEIGIAATGGNRPKWQFKYAADDFSFMFLRLPPPGSFTFTETNGQSAFQVFLYNIDQRRVTTA